MAWFGKCSRNFEKNGKIWQSLNQAYVKIWSLRCNRNETHEYYLLDDAKHEELKRDNHSLTFSIQPTEGHPDQILIEVPYHALDLQVKINGIDHYYYPIRPTQWTDKYVLGRAFFQAAYIMVNFDNNSFTLGQARFPRADEAPQLRSLVSQQPQGRLTGGIVGGALAGIIIFAVGYVVWRRRTRTALEKDKLATESEAGWFPTLLHESHQKPELAATPIAPPPAYRKRLWSNATTVSEVDGIDTMLASRLDCLREELNEIPEKRTPDEPFKVPVELEGSSVSPAELDGGFRGFEIADAMESARKHEATSTAESNLDMFASPPLAVCIPEHDEPVSPLASRSASRASNRKADLMEDGRYSTGL